MKNNKKIDNQNIKNKIKHNQIKMIIKNEIMYFEYYYTDGIKAFEDFKNICKFLINWTFNTIEVTFEYQNKKITVIKKSLKDIAKQMQDRGVKINIPKTTFHQSKPKFLIHIYGSVNPPFSLFLEGKLNLLKSELRKVKQFYYNPNIYLDLIYYSNGNMKYDILHLYGEKNLVLNKFIKEFIGIDYPLLIE
ncbi:MAG: hypothetical protein QXS99_05140 [Thermoplasmata archaeon]